MQRRVVICWAGVAGQGRLWAGEGGIVAARAGRPEGTLGDLAGGRESGIWQEGAVGERTTSKGASGRRPWRGCDRQLSLAAAAGDAR